MGYLRLSATRWGGFPEKSPGVIGASGPRAASWGQASDLETGNHARQVQAMEVARMLYRCPPAAPHALCGTARDVISRSDVVDVVELYRRPIATTAPASWPA